jgi:hypothetical protein
MTRTNINLSESVFPMSHPMSGLLFGDDSAYGYNHGVVRPSSLIDPISA